MLRRSANTGRAVTVNIQAKIPRHLLQRDAADLPSIFLRNSNSKHTHLPFGYKCVNSAPREINTSHRFLPRGICKFRPPGRHQYLPATHPMQCVAQVTLSMDTYNVHACKLVDVIACSHRYLSTGLGNIACHQAYLLSCFLALSLSCSAAVSCCST